MVPQENEAWFHGVGRKEFGVASLLVAEIVLQTTGYKHLAERLEALSGQCLSVSFDGPERTWEQATARCPGVWAHLAESILSVDGDPSPVWKRFTALFSFSHVAEIRAVRRYPEHLSDAGWEQILQSGPIPETDSGWLHDAMAGDDGRIETARSSSRSALKRAARSLTPLSMGWLTLANWTRLVSQELSPFDPRRGEWTGLEIVRQIVAPIVDDLNADQARLDRLHPNNVLVPESWTTKFPCQPHVAGVTWDSWRQFADSETIKLRPSATSVMDYRYFTETQGGRQLNEWERRLVGVGRLLLGVLRLNHDALRIWNIRGNERIFPLPRRRWFQSLAVSSQTLLLLDGCLSGRSAETRIIALNPELFGWNSGVQANDTEFDPRC